MCNKDHPLQNVIIMSFVHDCRNDSVSYLQNSLKTQNVRFQRENVYYYGNVFYKHADVWQPNICRNRLPNVTIVLSNLQIFMGQNLQNTSAKFSIPFCRILQGVKVVCNILTITIGYITKQQKYPHMYENLRIYPVNKH